MNKLRQSLLEKRLTRPVYSDTYSKTEVDTLFTNFENPLSWDEVTGKPTEFPPEAHTHDDRYYTESEVDVLIAAVGSVPWVASAVTFPSGKGAYEVEATVSDAACTALKTVEVKLAATADTDENEAEFLSPLTIVARPAAGSFVVSLSTTELTAGPVKLQYRIS